MSNRKRMRESDDIEEFEAIKAQAQENEGTALSVQQVLEAFFADGLITEILDEVKSGKEATVYCCRAHPSQGVPYYAAKVYRARTNRGFKNDSVYQEGRVVTDRRISRAIKNKSATGRDVQFRLWLAHEYATLTQLYKLGSDIPRPIAQTDSALLMEYFGDGGQPASLLQNTELDRSAVPDIFERLMDNIHLWLKHNIIHGDLSAYNMLYWNGRVVIIDFPQAIDPRFNSHAYNLLARDIENVCRYVGRYGFRKDATQITDRLWHQFRRATL